MPACFDATPAVDVSTIPLALTLEATRRYRTARSHPTPLAVKLMLEDLVVRDLAIIHDAHVRFTEGFNVVSGASGVGKSLLVQAVMLALGRRASSASVRAGCREAIVEARFRLRGRTTDEVTAIFGAGAPLEDGELVLRRVIEREGRSRATANGRMVSVAELRAIGERLADVHGQNEEQLLLRPAVQAHLLDEFADVVEERAAFGATLRRLRDRDVEAAERAKRLHDVAEREDILRFALREIDEVGVRPGELRALSEEVSRSRHASRIREFFSGAALALDETDGAALERLRSLESGLDALAREVEGLDRMRERLRDLVAAGEDLAASFRAESERVDLDPESAAQAEDRLDALRRLLKKHGPTEEDVIARRRTLESDLRALEQAEESAAEETAERAALVAELERRGDKLTRTRRDAARRLSAGVDRELAEVGLVGARFEIQVEPQSLERATESGMDRVAFLFSANAGEPLRPLGAVASGGETSRVMLALRSRLATADPVPLLVFDELDAAVGARFGRVLGEKLAALAKGRQVLCVTHLPQIAAFAAHHVRAEKEHVHGAVSTRFVELGPEERVQEIAHMIKGPDASALTVEQARELLAEAASPRPVAAKRTAR
ncbi:MAG: DNA repair protein RecN [Planctomycetes bacterium]|nr:DNA repair protein RecN [Planctomycetota bacterium]